VCVIFASRRTHYPLPARGSEIAANGPTHFAGWQQQQQKKSQSNIIHITRGAHIVVVHKIEAAAVAFYVLTHLGARVDHFPPLYRNSGVCSRHRRRRAIGNNQERRM